MNQMLKPFSLHKSNTRNIRANYKYCQTEIPQTQEFDMNSATNWGAPISLNEIKLLFNEYFPFIYSHSLAIMRV